MDRVETSKILSYVKVAYPDKFKDMSREDMERMLSLWQRKFADIPADLVFMAVDELVSESRFVPSIADVMGKLSDIYWKNFEYRWASNCGTLMLSPEQKNRIDYVHNSLAKIADDCKDSCSTSVLGERENNLLGGG